MQDKKWINFFIGTAEDKKEIVDMITVILVDMKTNRGWKGTISQADVFKTLVREKYEEISGKTK